MRLSVQMTFNVDFQNTEPFARDVMKALRDAGVISVGDYVELPTIQRLDGPLRLQLIRGQIQETNQNRFEPRS